MSPSFPDRFAPRCTIIAGSNGSGKSSLYEMVRPYGEFVNADATARGLNAERPEAASIAAGRKVIARLRVLIEERRHFVYETTLSSHQSFRLMRDARAAGYEVLLAFVTLADADLNVQRVANRVRRGGHSIPEATIRRRHRSAFERLAEAIPIAHASLIYDNTGYEAELLLRIENLAIVETHLDAQQPQHLGIAQAVATATGLDVREVFASSAPHL